MPCRTVHSYMMKNTRLRDRSRSTITRDVCSCNLKRAFVWTDCCMLSTASAIHSPRSMNALASVAMCLFILLPPLPRAGRLIIGVPFLPSVLGVRFATVYSTRPVRTGGRVGSTGVRPPRRQRARSRLDHSFLPQRGRAHPAESNSLQDHINHTNHNMLPLQTHGLHNLLDQVSRPTACVCPLSLKMHPTVSNRQYVLLVRDAPRMEGMHRNASHMCAVFYTPSSDRNFLHQHVVWVHLMWRLLRRPTLWQT